MTTSAPDSAEPGEGVVGRLEELGPPTAWVGFAPLPAASGELMSTMTSGSRPGITRS